MYFKIIAGACRLRVVSKYPKRFRSPREAEKFYFGVADAESDGDRQISTKSKELSTQTDDKDTSLIATKSTINELIKQYSDATQLEIISDMLCSYAYSQGVIVPKDFLELFLHASLHLKACNRTNVVYGLAKAVGILREDGTDSLMPARRMPMGLVEYLVNFFTANNLSKVHTI